MIYVVLTIATVEGEIETTLVGPFGNTKEAQNWIDTLPDDSRHPLHAENAATGSISIHMPTDPEVIDGTASRRHEDTDKGAV